MEKLNELRKRFVLPLQPSRKEDENRETGAHPSDNSTRSRVGKKGETMVAPPRAGSSMGHDVVPMTFVELLRSSTNRQSLLESYLQEQVAQLLGLPPSGVDSQQPLDAIGLNAGLKAALIEKIRSGLDIGLANREFATGFNVSQLASAVLEELGSSGVPCNPQPGDACVEHPLSFGQRALWFLQQLDASSIAYNVAYAARIPVRLDVMALERAFQKVVDRHPCLRSTFAARDREPVQRIHSHVPVDFHFEEASSWSVSTFAERLDKEMFRPFNLASGPLMRVLVFSRSSTDHWAMLNMHHLVTDMWSYAIILSEAGHLYRCEVNGEKPNLKPLRSDYAEHVRMQKEMLEGPKGEELWTHWRTHLDGRLPVLDLPTDHRRPPVQTHRGSAVFRRLDSSLTAQLKSLAKSHDTTLFAVTLAAFQSLVHLYTGEEDILVGSPKACRTATMGRVVGYFVNPVVMRADFSGNPTFSEFLDRTGRTVADSLANGEYPFPLLVERLQPERDLSRTPVFQVLFSWQKTTQMIEPSRMTSFALGEEGRQMALDGLPLKSVSLPHRVVPFDLSLLLGEAYDALNMTFEYNTALFDGRTVTRMLGHLENILRRIVANPDQHVASLSLLSDPEERRQLEEWKGGAAAPGPFVSVVQGFENRVLQNGESIALVSAAGTWTYAELNRRANQLARFLRRSGIGQGSAVALLIDRSVEAIVGLLGILKSGGTYLPIDPDCPLERLSFLLEDAQIPLLLTEKKYGDHVGAVNARVVCLDKDWSMISPESTDNPGWGVSPGDPAYVIYTSGSTGLPKGVLISHGEFAAHCRVMQQHYQLVASDRILQFASLSFDASLEQIIPPLLTGAGVVLRDRELWLPSEFHRKVEEYGITIINLPPAYWHQIVRLWSTMPDLKPLEKLRLAIIGGDVVKPESVELWSRTPMKSVRLLNAYGPTETTITAMTHEISRNLAHAAAGTSIPVGKPLAERRAFILNRAMRPVPPGVPGELYLGGLGLALGYLNRPDLSAEKFIPDLFSSTPGARLYRTGDLARHLADGTIEFIGRADCQVKVRGFRIEPGEIEAVLAHHPSVAEAAVVLREDNSGDRRLAAYLVPRKGEVIAIQELRALLHASLPSYMVPAAFGVLERIPLTPGGKIDRRALPAPDWGDRAVEKSFVAPRTPLEEELAVMLQEILGVQRVGVYDSFFDLGGHSLMATQFIALVRERFRVDLPIRSVFESPTIEGLSAALSRELAMQREQHEVTKLLEELESLGDEDARELLVREQTHLPS